MDDGGGIYDGHMALQIMLYNRARMDTSRIGRALTKKEEYMAYRIVFRMGLAGS